MSAFDLCQDWFDASVSREGEQERLLPSMEEYDVHQSYSFESVTMVFVMFVLSVSIVP